MKQIKFFILALFIGSSYIVDAQSFKINNDQSTLSVLGTSTLHDWKLDAEEIKGSAELEMKGKEILRIKTLSIEVPVAPMKSGLEALDKHIVTAMTANNSSVITFIMSEVKSLTKNTMEGYTVQADGKLTIVKNTKPVSLQATIEIKEDGSIRLFGKTVLSMADYDVDPPQAEMGSIKTEEEVKIVFDVVFVK